jgi:DNA-binding MarR family transcriptional regulator
MYGMSDELGFLIADAARLMRRAFDGRVRSRGVTRPQWRVLGLLSRFEGSSQSALAEMMDVEPISLARMIDRLAEAGLVERRPDPNDRRAWRLFLTPIGISHLEQLRPEAIALFDDALNGLSPEERIKLEAMLNVIRLNLSRRPTEAANG